MRPWREALGTPDSWELRRVEHIGIGSTGLLADWWVIIIAAESGVPAPLEFADRLSPELVAAACISDLRGLRIWRTNLALVGTQAGYVPILAGQ